nr:ABC transporter substrate-binding protein [uncultured Butyrivibrio sp.]
MKGYLKRGLCIGMAMALAFSFTGCGKEKKPDNELLEEASKASKDHVFSANAVDIDGLSENINRVGAIGDRVFAVSSSEDDYVYVYTFNPDGSDLKTTKIPSAYNMYYQNACPDKDGNVYAVCYKYNYEFEDEETSDEPADETSEDGEIGVAHAGEEAAEEKSEEASEEVSEEALEEASEETSEEGSENEEDKEIVDSEQESYFVKYDSDGKLLYQVDLMKEFASDEDYFDVHDFTVTDDGIILLSMEKGIFTYSEENGFKMVVDNAGQYMYYNFQKGFNGKLFVSYYGDTGYCLSTFDPKDGKIGEPSKVLGNGDYSFFGGNGYDLYISDNTAFYGYDAASDTKTKILDYVDSDIQLTNSTSLAVAISDVEFLACLPDDNYNYHLYRLNKIPPEQVKDKQILTIGGYYIDYDVRKQVYDFNQKSNEYKIKFVDYSSFDNEDSYGAGAEKFNMDIISGNTPDIIVVGSEMPVDSYINKGLFLDLTPYFEKDPDISESDMVTNVFDALKTNGKTYQVVPKFMIGTMLVKTKFVEGKDTITFDECKKLIEETGVNQQYAFGIIPRSAFLDEGLKYAGKNYIDWENKACHFDSESFVNFLEYSKNFMEEIPDSAYDTVKDTAYLNDEALFNITSINSFRAYNEYKKGYFGSDITLIGYPNEMGVNSSIIYPLLRIAVSAQSKSKDAAWDFVKKFYSEEYQKEVYEFPITKAAFEENGKLATQKPFYMDGDEKVEYDDYFYRGEEEIKIEPMSLEEVAEVTNFIKSLNQVYSSNDSIDSIITEEASAFYSGQKTAKEVADIIQSRVSIYVNENS